MRKKKRGEKIKIKSQPQLTAGKQGATRWRGSASLLLFLPFLSTSLAEFFKVPDKLDNTDNFHKLEEIKNEVVVWGTSSGPLVSCGQH